MVVWDWDRWGIWKPSNSAGRRSSHQHVLPPPFSLSISLSFLSNVPAPRGHGRLTSRATTGDNAEAEKGGRGINSKN